VSRPDGTGFEFGTVREADLPQVAAFLSGQDLSGSPGAWEATSSPGVDAVKRDLDWRFARNPCSDPDGILGHCIRRTDGTLKGVLLCLASRFALEDRILLGLCGCGFYVEPELRLQAFLLFHRFLKTPGPDFVFATTCNQASGALWSKLGGKAVRDSRCEYLFPVRPGPIIEELLLRKGVGRLAGALGRAVGRIVPRRASWKRAGRNLRLSPCRDWERLADLAGRHRDPSVLTTHRAPDYLEWRYDRTPARSSNEVLVFDDGKGNQGWVALAESRRGRTRQIRTWTLLDLAYPRAGFELRDLLGAVLRRFSERADMITIRGPERLGQAAVALGARRREFPAPLSYITARGGQSDALARSVELFPADGDTVS